MNDAFVDAYFAIDKDCSGSITYDELEFYMKENDFDESFVTKWIKLFDTNKTGQITLEEFCEVLGLEIETVKEERIPKLQICPPAIPSHVNVISTDMGLDDQIGIIETVQEQINTGKPIKDVAKLIKMALDKKFDRLWHCVIVKGQYWAYYSHEPSHSIIFKMGADIFIIWRTPF